MNGDRVLDTIVSASDFADTMQRACDADEKYGNFASAHEAYGVLAEEMTELLEVVRLRQGDPSRPHRLRDEALDIAAVALRLATQAERLTR